VVTLTHIQDARAAIADRIHRTPLLSSRSIGARIGASAYLKAEPFQRTGSFKVRGVFNRLRLMSPEQRRAGVIGWSAGNHAAALAYAANTLGIPCTVVMPESAVKSKVEACKSYGAEIVQHGVGMETYNRMQQLREEKSLTLVHPFDDLEVIAGAGTIGLEILDDLPHVDVIVVPVGGGGLISGIATAIKSIRPQTKVYGVEPEGAAGLTAALREGKVVRLERTQTIADGLAAPFTGDNALKHVHAFVDDVVLVNDDEIAAALRYMLERTKVLVEPAGAAATAALLMNRIPLSAHAHVVAIASGGNVDASRLREILQ
jgi:threonine dehydratase